MSFAAKYFCEKHDDHLMNINTNNLIEMAIFCNIVNVLIVTCLI